MGRPSLACESRFSNSIGIAAVDSNNAASRGDGNAEQTADLIGL
jgi:hypothetical protein